MYPTSEWGTFENVKEVWYASRGGFLSVIWKLMRFLEIFEGVLKVQNYFHNHTVTLFDFFTLILS